MPATVLSYNTSHELVTQEEYFNCGPGSSQLCLDARGIYVSEADLSAVLGTTTDGTPSIDCIATGLNHFDPESAYASMWMPDESQIDLMRERIFRTVAWSRGCVANVVVPPSNYPRAVPKSDPNLPGASGESPNYAGGVVYHYVSILGADDTDDTVMIVDPGFMTPSGGSAYWVTVTQLASMVTPHGIVYSEGAPAVAQPGIPTLPGPAGPMVANAQRYWPVTADRFVTSPFGPRDGGFHSGVDFGFNGGSGGRPVFAIQSGTVQFSGPAQGYGGPDPAGWLVIDSDDSQGSGVFEYGHVVRLPHITTGEKVNAGDQIGTINPDESSNGGVAPHLHLSYMPRGYDPVAKMDPLPLFDGAAEPAVVVAPSAPNHAAPPQQQQQTCLTGRPHHHAENAPTDQQILDIRAEGLCTQALVFKIAEKLGLDAAGIYQAARDSF